MNGWEKIGNRGKACFGLVSLTRMEEQWDMSNRLLQNRLMPDTCLSLEIPQIQQISTLPNESLGKSEKWSMYSSEEGKMQMKTNEKPLSFMFQVPNYAWHFNFPKACFRKIVLNSPQSVKASISSSSGIKQVWFSSVLGVKCNHCYSTAQLAFGRSTECLYFHGWASQSALQ